MMARSINLYTPAASSATTQRQGERMPFAMPAPQCSRSSAFTGVILLQTGVITSVSLFVLGIVPLVFLVLLVGLVVLISLLLTGLTRLEVLARLVGLKSEQTARTAQGE